MRSPTIAAWPIIEKTKVSRRARYSPSFSPDSMEKIFGPGPGDAAVIARSCQRSVDTISPTRPKTRNRQKGFPQEKVRKRGSLRIALAQITSTVGSATRECVRRKPLSSSRLVERNGILSGQMTGKPGVIHKLAIKGRHACVCNACPESRRSTPKLLEDRGEESSNASKEAAVLCLLLRFRWWRLNHDVEMNLAGRRIVHRQVFGRLHRRR